MDAALEAANPAKTSRLEIRVIPRIFLLGIHSVSTVARDQLASHFDPCGLIYISDLSIAIRRKEMQISVGS